MSFFHFLEMKVIDPKMESTQKEEMKKCCCHCKTTRTPLWRSGPSGPKSLCNACGIRHRKSVKNDGKKKKKQQQLLQIKLVGRQWGEVERAALLLMALSCGAVFA